MKKDLTVLIGAGAVIEVSDFKTTTNTITEAVLKEKCVYNIHRKEIKTLLRKIYKDLNKISKRYNCTPNFEDIFHCLEILTGLTVVDNASPNHTPAAKIFSNIKAKYKNYKGDGRMIINGAIEHILNVIKDKIELYDLKKAPDWYFDFFKKITDNFNTSIFNLNYDCLIEKSLQNYNDGFVISQNNGDYFYFDPKIAVSDDIFKKNGYKINHLHGQLDFTFIDPQIARDTFGDNDFSNIYKIRNSNIKRDLTVASGGISTQSGEHIPSTAIITGKMKTEKILTPPFDTYKINLHTNIINSPNLLIIGYGFNDLYINSLLKQFYKIHKENAKAIIIDFCTEKDWINETFWQNSHYEKYHTVFNISGDNPREYDRIMRNRFQNIITINNCRLCLTGFRDAAQNNLNNILNFY